MVGLILPLAASWWRNHQVIGSYPYVFTWDGIATGSADFNMLSTLVLQAHPTVREGLRTLHEMILPRPEWLTQWDLLLFMLGGVLCLAVSRRIHLLIAAGLSLLYFTLFDRTLSSNFLRILLGLFPVFFVAIGHAVARMHRLRQPVVRWLGGVLVVLVLISGRRYLDPPPMDPLERFTPPPELLTGDAYMVNSGFYNPESLIYRFRDKRFIGMPLAPEQFEDFRRHYPDYHLVLWHEPSVQNRLAGYLRRRYPVATSAVNQFGQRYFVVDLDRTESP